MSPAATQHTGNGTMKGDEFRSYLDDRDAPSQETVYCTANGVPVTHPYEVQRAPGGPLLLQDHHLIDLLSHFDRERCAERVVHENLPLSSFPDDY